MKVLFIEPYPTEGPSSRYRVEQYIPYLRDNDIECYIRPFVSSKFYKIIYREGDYPRKVLFFLQSSIRRFFDLFTVIHYDIVFIHLEAFPFGPPLFEWIFKKLGKKIIYDLDDAIYINVASPMNKFMKYLKCSSKVKKIIKISSSVITCNQYLADYANKYNNNVTVIHTSIDTTRFLPKVDKSNQDIVIGWIGSHSTASYLMSLRDVFLELSLKYRFVLKIVGAGIRNFEIPDITVMNFDWHLENEVEQFQSLDIGVYPLPRTEWTLGKTGFKTIQYMSVGIPCVVSRVGANKDIVVDGVNGFCVDTKDEWLEKLSLLIEKPELRYKMGLAGRDTVEQRYSVKANVPKILEILRRVYNERHN